MQATVCTRSSEDSTGQGFSPFTLLGQLCTPASLAQELLGGSLVSASHFDVVVQALQIRA